MSIQNKGDHNKGRMNILALIDQLPSEENPNTWGHALGQVRSLSEECDITIVSPVWLPISLRSYTRNKKRIRKLPPYKYRIGTIPCLRPRYIDFSFIPWQYRKHYFQIVSMIVSLLFLIVTKKIRFEIIHAHFVYRPGYVAAILGKILRKPVIITAHGSDIHQNLYSEDTVIRKRTINALQCSKCIIAVSENLKNMIIDEGFGDKTFVIPCGFSYSKIFQMDANKCRVKLFLETNKKILLFIGNLVAVKGVDVLIEAFRIVRDKIDNIDLLIVGDGPESDSLKQQVYKIGLKGMVYFLGRKNHTEIPLYVNASDILAVPSRNEGRSVAIIEALACGKPVVASRVGGIPETIVNDKLGILVEKENPVALAEGIINALNKTWDERYISNYAKQYAQGQLIPHVLKIYDKVLSRV